MTDRNQITKLIFECLEALNLERAPNEQIQISEKTALLSDNSTLDSLAFVSFSTDLEDRLLELTGKDLMLATAALSATDQPFRSVAALADFITTKLASA
jgi:acyl carrier protein